MANGEVGQLCDDLDLCSSREEVPENIYVLPILEESPGEKFRLLVLADGNNRAELEGKSYDYGGKHVVNIAQRLAERGDVSLMVACILSPDNIRKRGQEFFRKLHRAFVGLGVRMETQRFLVDDGIRLEFYGDLDKVASHSEEGAAIAQMIPWLRQKTAHITDPRLRLVLALAYDESIAEHFGVHMVFRSGLEWANSFRSSGIRACGNTLHVGSMSLWPNVGAGDIEEAIAGARSQIRRTFSSGYGPDDIGEMAAAFNDLGFLEKPVALTIPYSEESGEEVLSLSDGLLSSAHRIRFTFFNDEGKLVRSFGPELAKRRVQLVPPQFSTFAEGQEGVSNDFSFFLAPGQMRKGFLLPENPSLGNATVLGCNLDAIMGGVAKAVRFSLENELLRGGERDIFSWKGPHKDWRHEYYRIAQWAGAFAGCSSEQEKNALSQQFEGKERSLIGSDVYYALGELFVAKMIPWAEEHDLPMGHSFQYRAVINYFLTPYFMVNCPDHPQWEQFKLFWEEVAEGLAIYMGNVYLGDERIFDLDLKGEMLAAKKERLKMCAHYLQSVIQKGSVEGVELPNLENAHILRSIAITWVKYFIEPYADKSHPVLFQRWRDALGNLYGSSIREWEEEDESGAIKRNGGTEEKPAASTMPNFIENKLQSSCATAAARYEQRLYTYLLGIMDSIGAGLAFRTVSLTLDPSEVDDEVVSLLDEICALSNFYFRIKNDIAGYLSRGEDDQEAKKDSFSLACDYFSYKGPLAAVFAISDLKERCDEMKQEIVRKTHELRQKAPFMAMVISRASIAEDIYDGGHYRTRTSVEMREIFSKNRRSGVD